MACFLVSGAEAAVVTAVRKFVEHREIAKGIARKVDGKVVAVKEGHLLFSRKLGWLMNMLWGGAFLLLIEHVWHGEVVPWFPFLTAMRSPDETVVMLHEMATVGVGMAALVTVVWGAMCAVADWLEARGAVLTAMPAETAGFIGE